MSGQEIADFYPLTTAVSPSQVSGFLASQQWTLVDIREGAFERWAAPGFNPDHYPQVLYLLPLDSEYADFDRRFAELMAALADRYTCDADSLHQLISSRHWDSLTVRLAHTDPDADTIGLTEARDTLEAIYRLLEVSARYTDNPYTSFAGRRSQAVVSYMRERVTLGHTQRGSFIFPVYSLLDGRGGSPASFCRAVMENLAKGLSWLHGEPSEAEHDDTMGGTQRLAVMLAKALLPLAELPDLKSIGLSLQWASGRPGPGLDLDGDTLFTPESIRTAHGSATQAAERHSPRSTQWDDPGLTSAAAPRSAPSLPSVTYDQPERVDFSGPVLAVTLDNRASLSSGTGGFVVVGRDESGAPREVQVAITEEDYYSAVAAQRARALVTVTGTIFRDRAGTWWVDGQIRFGAERSALPSAHTPHDDEGSAGT
ncbi:hypothetical protein [Streptomyces sp. NPDC048272]|uniref:hypothetical protein n=1 Tax=Streptomyces sp. NPDC048272 TaxID=3154616 RepID=UPI0034225053